MKTCCLFLICFVVIGCSLGKKNTDKTDTLKKETKVSPIVSLDTTIKIVRTITPFNGEIYYKAGWKDSNGENVFILSKSISYNDGTGRAEVYGYHYIKYNNSWKRSWYSFDFVDGAGCDLTIDIPQDLISITDIDQNATAEIAYLYTLDNRCDAVVVPTKMVVVINKITYSISGFSQLSLGPAEAVMNQYLKEEGKPEIAFKLMSKNWNALDKSLQNYYSQLWDNYAVR